MGVTIAMMMMMMIILIITNIMMAFTDIVDAPPSHQHSQVLS